MAADVTTEYRFAPIPEALLYDTSIDDKAVRIFAVLMRHGMSPEQCYPSHTRIAELIGCEKRSVQRPLRKLEQAGWISRVKRFDAHGGRLSDGFVVHVDAHQRATTARQSADPPARQSAMKESHMERENDGDASDDAPPPSKRTRKTSPESDEITKQFWESRSTKPLIKFVALRALVDEALKAGYDRGEIIAALGKCPTFTRGWLESKLSEQRQRQRRAPAEGADWYKRLHEGEQQ